MHSLDMLGSTQAIRFGSLSWLPHEFLNFSLLTQELLAAVELAVGVSSSMAECSFLVTSSCTCTQTRGDWLILLLYASIFYFPA